jgi:hypothetical protein
MPRWRRLRMPGLRIPQGRWRYWALGSLVVVAVLTYSVAFLIDEPMRRSMERQLNARLKGYTARVGKLDFHPHGFSLDLKDIVITQDAYPDPPVARIRRLSASVEWRALLSGRLVGDVEIIRPKVNLNLAQARAEIKDEVPVEKRGWQEALEAVYPLKINTFVIRRGEIVYTDEEGPFAPLRLRHLTFEASNIQNVRSKDRTYPSEVHLAASVFERGKLQVDGHADFLAVPHPAVLADVRFEGVELDYFRPLTRHYDVAVKGGLLSADGRVEYAPSVKTVELRDARIDGVTVEYVHKGAKGVRGVSTVANKAGKAAAEVATEKPGLIIRAAHLEVARSTFGLVNAAAKPQYRLFLSDANVKVKNLSNQRAEGVGDVELTGKFLGTGATAMQVRFRPGTPRPDMDIKIRITDTEMQRMNDLLRAHGGFDVKSGSFSFFSEISVNKGQVAGYVKPLFKDLDVYDPQQDRHKNIFRRAYEAVVGAIAQLLENRPRDEVATKTAVSGRIDNPNVGTMEAIVRLVQNAFAQAILPGFDREIRRKSSSG